MLDKGSKTPTLVEFAAQQPAHDHTDPELIKLYQARRGGSSRWANGLFRPVNGSSASPSGCPWSAS